MRVHEAGHHEQALHVDLLDGPARRRVAEAVAEGGDAPPREQEAAAPPRLRVVEVAAAQEGDHQEVRGEGRGASPVGGGRAQSADSQKISLTPTKLCYAHSEPMLKWLYNRRKVPQCILSS
jgi:hypothetical protein